MDVLYGFSFAVLSIAGNVFIAVLGIVPSAFITAANISYFGFEYGLIVSIIGEAVGAIISFWLYRKGFSHLKNNYTVKWQFFHRLLERLRHTNGLEAIILVLLLRLFPFVPSGVVTLTAAISKMGIVSFATVSTVGKIPALYMEAYSVNSFLGFDTTIQLAITFALLVLLLAIYFAKNKRLNKK